MYLRLLPLAALLLILSMTPAGATSCIPMTQAELAERADLIFRGQVTAVRYPIGGGTVATFRVEEIVKGPALAAVEIRTWSDRTRIIPGDPAFQTGERWELYARRDEQQQYVTSACMGNRYLSGPQSGSTGSGGASDDGAPDGRAPGNRPPGGAAPWRTWLYAGGLLAAAGLLAGVSRLRR